MKLKERAKQLKSDIPALFLALGDKETPAIAKTFAGLTIVYALSPISLRTITDVLVIFQSFPTFIIAAGLVELGFGVEQAATSTWTCDYIKSETRATYSSIFSTIQAVGGFVITNLLGLMTESISEKSISMIK